MGWGPKFTHNISLFYPEAILNYFGVQPRSAVYPILLKRVSALIETEVLAAAKNLNALLRVHYRKDISDIDEYSVIDYWSVLDAALSSPLHIGVVWSGKLVQAKFVDTNILGGLKELQDVQHEAYPQGTGNLGAWTSLYKKWRAGQDDKIGDTLRRRLTIMLGKGIAPFAELLETGNEFYPAYPHHPPKNTLEAFKPYYRREMSAAYHRVVSAAQPIIEAALVTDTMSPTQVVSNTNQLLEGFTWTSKLGRTIFVTSSSMKTINGRLMGAGFIISSSGNILREWHGWLPR
jgi:hypothetical protein